MPFPLLKLPYLGIERVLPNFEFDEIIEFSLCSSKCRYLIRSLKRHRYNAISLLVSDGNETTIWVKTGERTGSSWNLTMKPPKVGESLEGIEVKTINGVEIRIRKSGNHEITSEKIPVSQVKVVYNYLQELLKNLPVDVFHFNPTKTIDVTLLPKHFGIQKCGELYLYADKKPIPEDQLRYALKDIQVSRYLGLQLPKNPNFRMDSLKLSTDELQIDAQWMSRDTFLTLDCSRILLRNVTFSPKDFQDFVAQWLNSKSFRLIWLKIFLPVPLASADFSMFQTRSWDSDDRGRYFELSHENARRGGTKVDCSQGMDLIRSDNLMATVLLKSRTTYFLVWHNRFPNLTGFPNDSYLQ